MLQYLSLIPMLPGYYIARLTSNAAAPHDPYPFADVPHDIPNITSLLNDVQAECASAGLTHLTDTVAWVYSDAVISVWTTPERDCFVLPTITLRGPIRKDRPANNWLEISTAFINPDTNEPYENNIMTRRTKKTDDPIRRIQITADDKIDPNDIPPVPILDAPPSTTVEELIALHRESTAAIDAQLAHHDADAWAKGMQKFAECQRNGFMRFFK